MIVSQSEVRNRIEQIKLSYEGYRRQIEHLDLSGERRDRLETDIRLLKDMGIQRRGRGLPRPYYIQVQFLHVLGPGRGQAPPLLYTKLIARI